MTASMSAQDKSSSGSGNNAAMNLWKKFSELQSAIESSRQERDKILTEVEGYQAEERGIIEQNRQYKQDNRRHEGRSHVLREQVATLRDDYQNEAQVKLAEAKLAAEREKNRSHQRESDEWTQYETFLEQSREFRKSCKRLKVEAEAQSNSKACVQGFIESTGTDTSDQLPTLGLDDMVGDDDDPTTWKVHASDHEMHDAMAQYKQHCMKSGDEKAQLQELRKQLESLVEESEVRADQMEQLQKQLSRIMGDNEEIGSQVLDLKRFAEDSEGVSATLRTELESRQEAKQGAFSARNTVTPPPNQATAQQRDANVIPISNNPYARNRSESYDYRGSRRHRDKQFGTSIQIGSAVAIDSVEDGDDDDDALLNYVAFN